MKLDQSILKKEISSLISTSIATFLILKIVFFKESFLIILKTLGAFYFFLIPGLLLTYLIFDKLEFLERFCLGAVTGFAMLGMLSYYVGILFRIHVRHYTPYLAVFIVLIELFLLYVKNNKLIRKSI